MLSLLGILHCFLDGLLHGFLDNLLYGRFENLVMDQLVACVRHDLLDGLLNSLGERTQLVNQNRDSLLRFLLL